MKLYIEEHGDGHPLLLITGLVDNRGAGHSPKPPGPYAIEELADDAAEVLEGRRAHVAGFSMGGYIEEAPRFNAMVTSLLSD